MTRFDEIQSGLSDEQANKLLASGQWEHVDSVSTGSDVRHVLGRTRRANSTEAHSWSRHYDVLQWTVCGLLLTASGYLFVQCLDKSDGTARVLSIFGAALVLLSIAITLQFRALRRQVHDAFDAPDIRLIENRNPVTLNHLNLGAQIIFWSAWMIKLGMLFTAADWPHLCLASFINFGAVLLCALQS